MDRKANIGKNTIEDKPVNKNVDEAVDKATNSCSLGTYLYDLHSSSNKKPKCKDLSKKKPMSTTLTLTPTMPIRIMNRANTFPLRWALYQYKCERLLVETFGKLSIYFTLNINSN